jgi:hypothetical protein
LTVEQAHLWVIMEDINTQWMNRLEPPQRTLTTSKQKRDASEGESSDGDAERKKTQRKKKRKQPQVPAKKTPKTQLTQAEGRQHKGGKQATMFTIPPRFCYPTPPTSLAFDRFSYHDPIKAITVWLNNVHAAGPPSKIPRNIIWDDGQVAQVGLLDWHKWRMPWTRPACHEATSNDWAIMVYGIRLTKPLIGHYPEESMYSSDGSPTELGFEN